MFVRLPPASLLQRNVAGGACGYYLFDADFFLYLR